MTIAPFVLVHDIDNTAGLYNEALQRTLRRWGHPAGWYAPPSNYNFAKAGWFRTIEEFLDYHRRAVEDGLFLDMEPAPGAVDAIVELADRGVSQVIATHRDIPGIQHIVRDTTLAWLEKTFPITFDGVYFTADKWTVPGDLYIDDAPAVIESLDARGLNRLVMDAPNYNQHLPGPRVQSWTEVVPYVDAMLAKRREVAA